MSILFFIGVLIAAIGGLLYAASAFRHGVFDGLIYVFMPPCQVYFVIRHWPDAKLGFIVASFGAALIAISAPTYLGAG